MARLPAGYANLYLAGQIRFERRQNFRVRHMPCFAWLGTKRKAADEATIKFRLADNYNNTHQPFSTSQIKDTCINSRKPLLFQKYLLLVVGDFRVELRQPLNVVASMNAIQQHTYDFCAERT